MIQTPTTNMDWVIDGLKDHPCIPLTIEFSMFPKKTSQQIKKNNLRKKLLKSNLPWTSELGYPWAITPLPDDPCFSCEFQQKAPSVLDSVQEP